MIEVRTDYNQKRSNQLSQLRRLFACGCDPVSGALCPRHIFEHRLESLSGAYHKGHITKDEHDREIRRAAAEYASVLIARVQEAGDGCH